MYALLQNTVLAMLTEGFSQKYTTHVKETHHIPVPKPGHRGSFINNLGTYFCHHLFSSEAWRILTYLRVSI